MSEETPRADRAEGAEERPPLPLWKKAAFVVALVLGLVGVGLTQMGGGDQPATAGGARPSGLAAQPESFAGGGALGSSTARSGDAPVEEPSPWGPFLMKGGLSFAIAFAVGLALRTFLTMTIVVLGVVALAIFGLQKAGVVGEVDWAVAQGYWDSLTANVGAQFESFRTFLTGSLPSAGAGTVGLAAGFRR